MKQACVLFIFLVTALTAYAQPKLPLTRQAARSVARPISVPAGQVLSSPAKLNALSSMLESSCAHATIQAAAPVSTLPAKNRPWLVQQQRNLKAWNLKRQRRLRDQENRKIEEANRERQALEATLPKPNPEHTFEIADFTPLLADDLPTDFLPLLEEPGMLYRGMALDSEGSSVENILTNGLRVQDLGKHATTRLLANSGGLSGLVRAVRPVINLTSSPDKAVFWALQRTEEEAEKPLLVVVGVNGQTQSGDVVISSADIPASQITHVIVPLNIRDTPTWCRVELTPQHTFLITPYDIRPPLPEYP